MKLTKTHKDAFVRAVMDDVPKIDYNELARKFVFDRCVELLPECVKQAWQLDKGWVNTKYITTPGGLNNVNAPALYVQSSKEYLGEESWSSLEELAKKLQQQNNAHNDLRSKVRAVIESCNTLKQAKERLPEFEKYLPLDSGKQNSTGNFVVVSNVVAQLTHFGWPRGKEELK